jgi:hypothetical protein
MQGDFLPGQTKNDISQEQGQLANKRNQSGQQDFFFLTCKNREQRLTNAMKISQRSVIIFLLRIVILITFYRLQL